MWAAACNSFFGLKQSFGASVEFVNANPRLMAIVMLEGKHASASMRVGQKVLLHKGNLRRGTY